MHMQMKEGMGRDLVQWVFIAKGIGILLVVAGHFCPETAPAYWKEIKGIIYSFHMPLFFILSGYLYQHGKYRYGQLMKNKAHRLLYPFITIAGIFFIIKYAAGRFVALDHPLTGQSILALAVNPMNSFMPLLWFVHALLIIFALYPLVRLVMNNFSLLVVLLLVNTVFSSDYAVVGNALAHMPFFVVGVMMRENAKAAGMILRADWRYGAAQLVIFALLYMAGHVISMAPVIRYPVSFLLGVAGSLCVVTISSVISSYAGAKSGGVLLQIGYYSMTIYLLHTLFESTVRIGFLQVFKQTDMPFLLIACVALACGTAIPLWLEKKVLRRYGITRKFVLGLSDA